MKVKPIIAIGCLALGTIFAFLILSFLHREPESISISILDGTGLGGAEVLNAIYMLSSELPVEINFRTTESAAWSITAMSRKEFNSLPVDLMSIEVRSKEFRLDGEILLEDRLRSRLLEYAEAASLVNSQGLVIVVARDEATGVQLVRLFQILCDSGNFLIVPTYTPNAAYGSAMASPIPFRVD